MQKKCNEQRENTGENDRQRVREREMEIAGRERKTENETGSRQGVRERDK